MKLIQIHDIWYKSSFQIRCLRIQLVRLIIQRICYDRVFAELIIESRFRDDDRIWNTSRSTFLFESCSRNCLRYEILTYVTNNILCPMRSIFPDAVLNRIPMLCGGSMFFSPLIRISLSLMPTLFAILDKVAESCSIGLAACAMINVGSHGFSGRKQESRKPIENGEKKNILTYVLHISSISTCSQD